MYGKVALRESSVPHLLVYIRAQTSVRYRDSQRGRCPLVRCTKHLFLALRARYTLRLGQFCELLHTHGVSLCPLDCKVGPLAALLGHIGAVDEYSLSGHVCELGQVFQDNTKPVVSQSVIYVELRDSGKAGEEDGQGWVLGGQGWAEGQTIYGLGTLLGGRVR